MAKFDVLVCVMWMMIDIRLKFRCCYDADDVNCGTPAWIGKGLTCVCFKAKGNNERVCLNLTPLQASD